jgi:hypothetical protein
MTPMRIFLREIWHQQEKPPPPPDFDINININNKPNIYFRWAYFSLKRCKSDKKPIRKEAWEWSSKSNPVAVEGIMWLPILLLLQQQFLSSSWEQKSHHDQCYMCCYDDACENTSRKNMAPIDNSVGETTPPPPKILISISTTNLTYILHNARRHTRTYACTHCATW